MSISGGDHLGKRDGGLRVVGNDSAEDLDEVGAVVLLLAVWGAALPALPNVGAEKQATKPTYYPDYTLYHNVDRYNK